MKATTKLFLMLVVGASILTFTSCKKEKILPEKITVTGQVKYENGDNAEGVAVQVISSYIMAIPAPVDEPVYTNENGHYIVEFEPHKDLTYHVKFHIIKDGYSYNAYNTLTLWEAEQVCNAVLVKVGE